jgi:nucleoside-diphosphate-sugar epimerase
VWIVLANILSVGLGDIGYRVALALHEQGHRVTGLKRSCPATPPPFPLITADISLAASLNSLPVDFDTVLFIVAPGSRQPEPYRALYVDGLNNLLAHFARAGATPCWLMVSSSSVYGQNRGEWVDETSATEPTAATSRYLLAAEQCLSAAVADHCVVRFSGIYGPGRDWLLRRAQSGEAAQRQPPYFTNRIHRDDCVAVVLFLLEKMLAGDILQRCYLASDNDPAPIWDVMNWIAAEFGYPPPVALDEPADALQNKRCNNARLTALGYRLLYPGYRDGYRSSEDKS